MSRQSERRDFFKETVGGRRYIPFFLDGIEAQEKRLFVAACLCFIAGIEAAIRIELLDKAGKYNDLSDLPKQLHTNLCNRLLREALKTGLDVSVLAYTHECDKKNTFRDLVSKNEPPVGIVELRNNIMHGNNFQYASSDGGQAFFDQSFFAKDAAGLFYYSTLLALEIAKFRGVDISRLPSLPDNPADD